MALDAIVRLESSGITMAFRPANALARDGEKT
jgi:hypothetical protein